MKIKKYIIASYWREDILTMKLQMNGLKLIKKCMAW